uniref:Uncharacterized protein n=1 Tax=Triticum urartu TaxID=4572 RepID=A0A8R7VBI4_TRIUA
MCMLFWFCIAHICDGQKQPMITPKKTTLKIESAQEDNLELFKEVLRGTLFRKARLLLSLSIDQENQELHRYRLSFSWAVAVAGCSSRSSFIAYSTEMCGVKKLQL